VLILLLVLGGISLLLGLIFMVGKDNLQKFEDMLNKSLTKTQDVGYKYSKLIGLILLVLGGVLLYIGWSVK